MISRVWWPEFEEVRLGFGFDSVLVYVSWVWSVVAREIGHMMEGEEETEGEGEVEHEVEAEVEVEVEVEMEVEVEVKR